VSSDNEQTAVASQHSAIVERMTDGAFVLDSDWRLEYATEPALAYADESLSELAGRPIMSLTEQLIGDGETATAFEQALDAVYQGDDGTEYPITVEVELDSDAGTVVREYRCSPYVTDGERKAVVIGHDITERKSRELKYEEATEMLTRMQETISTTQPLHEKMRDLLDIGRDFLGIDHGCFTRLEGDTQEIVVGTGPYEQLQEGATAPVEESYCRHTVEPTQDEPMTVTKARDEGWEDDPAFERFGLSCYIGATIETDSDTYGTVCFCDRNPIDRSFSDIEQQFVELLTEWAGYELTQSERERQFQRLTERLPDVFYAVDSEWRVTTWNGAAEDQFGILAADIIGESLWERLPESDTEPPGPTHKQTMDTREPTTCEYYHEGGDYWMEVQAFPHQDGIGVIASEITEHKRRISALLDNIPVIVFKFDADGILTESRGQALERIGLEPGEAVGSDIREMYADYPEICDSIECALDGEQVRMVSDVGELSFETQYRPITDEDGTVEEVIGISLDVTEQRDRERRLEENDAILQQLTETTDDVFWLFNSDFTELQFINDAYEDVWGLSISALRNDPQDFMNGVHPDDKDIVRNAIGTLQDGESTDNEYRVNPNDDFSRWVRVKGEPIYEDGDLVRVAGFARDITERKEREQQLAALSESTEQLSYAKTPESVAENVVAITEEILGEPLAAVWRYDEETDRLSPWVVSENATSIGEQSGTDGLNPIIPGTDEMAAFRSDGPTYIPEYQALDTQSHPEAEIGSVLLCPIGEYAMLCVGSVSVDAFDPGDTNLVTILTSHAGAAFERAEREQALETYKNKLKKSNENLQEFAYIASHDLQEPLRSVTSYLGLIESEYHDQLDDDGQFYVERAESNAARMSSMIDALLQYSRVETQGGEFTEVDVEKVVSDTIDSLGVLISETAADITVGDLPTVTADGDQLGQVFQNLVKNAIEHGGDPPEVDIQGVDTGDAWEFSVSDTGPGIPESQHDRVFEIFQQATDEDDDTGEAGIGLSICERIVARHHGEIWIESSNEGSTFKFRLPKEEPR
jgi:PAS domain S-box-containing protein